MRKASKEKLYLCRGENFVDNVRIGFCGDVHTLEEWLEILFPGQNAVEYFGNDSPGTVLDYIYQYKGKRLEAIK